MQILALMMILMTSSHSALADQSLTCHNDFFNNITCVWDTSKLDVTPPVRPETVCRIHVTLQRVTKPLVQVVQMFADPAQPRLRSATVAFKSGAGKISQGVQLEEEVRCDGYTNPVAKRARYEAQNGVVKAAPPHSVRVHGDNVSWSFVPVRPFYKPEYGLQYRSAAQSWKDVEDSVVNTDDHHLALSEERLLLNQQYVVRVRVKYTDLPKSVWSDWSEEYSWTSTVGQMRPTPGTPPEILQWKSSVVGAVIVGVPLAIILTLLIKCRRILSNVASSSFVNQKSGSKYIPDPSEFFGDLQSSHGGNFMSWLGPVLARESFLRVDTEFISSVEVLKLPDACESRGQHRNSGGPQDSWDSATKSSNFSNSTYFMSQSSKGPGDTLEPCSPHSSYGPAGGVSEVTCTGAEKNAEELEKLRQDTQSPDSGFAGGGEDSMEETELPSPLALNPAPLLPRDLPAPQPSKHLLADLLLRPSCSIPALDLDLLTLDLQSSRGLIEPSSGDYMPVKNVQS